MGTQRSSEGPGSGVSLVPSWVLPVDPLPEAPEGEPSPTEASPEAQPEKKDDIIEVPQVSQPARFAGARRNLGSFAKSGSSSDLKAGLGHYVSRGYSGAAQLARRMGGTARTAGALYGGLQGYSSGENKPAEFGLDKNQLQGLTPREAGDRIIEAICPIDGSQDSEARRDSLSESISELIEQNPDLNLTALTPEQIDFLIERFVANDLAHRVELDIGKKIFEKAPSMAEAVKRLDEVRGYVREKVSASFKSRKDAGQKMTRTTTTRLTASVLKDTLAVFESYI